MKISNRLIIITFLLLALSIVGGALGGWWLDGLAGSSPVFLLLGLLLGIVVAFYGTYRMTRALMVGDDDSSRLG